jgi:hypothetical protein
MNQPLALRYQYRQCDRPPVPLAVGALFGHATGGYRCWMRMDWWRIRGPSKTLRLPEQWTENSLHTIPHGWKARKPRHVLGNRPTYFVSAGEAVLGFLQALNYQGDIPLPENLDSADAARSKGSNFSPVRGLPADRNDRGILLFELLVITGKVVRLL